MTLQVQNPYESYNGPQEETDGPCDQCNRIVNCGEMAYLAGRFICDRCFDPKQPASDIIIATVEQQDAEIANLRRQIHVLRLQSRKADKVW
jgi:hypothetical protein